MEECEAVGIIYWQLFQEGPPHHFLLKSRYRVEYSKNKTNISVQNLRNCSYGLRQFS